MTTVENTRAIFSILHDGSISAWSGDQHAMTLTVECRYLAERIAPSFDRFYVELLQVDTLFLTTWPRPVDAPAQVLSAPGDIFTSELEILDAAILDGKVVIACKQHDRNLDYSGGNLTIHCGAIKVFDQDKNELTMKQIQEISEKYWDAWNKQ